MRVLDLFSGIGGFSLGLERAGMRTVAFCEIDPFCRRVLAKHWPDVHVWGDIRTLTASALADAIGLRKLQSEGRQQDQRGWVGNCGVDVICGGFPCQDISVAGKGAGIEGSRSGLWSEYARVIGEVRPRYVIVENVSALLSRGLGRVLGDLAALGFDAEWHCIPASAVGAPHRRDRVWIVAHTARDVRSQQTESRTERQRIGASSQSINVADANGSRLAQRQEHQLLGQRAALIRSDWWSVEPDVGRVAHGVPARVDRLRALGNALVPQIPEIIGRAILDADQPYDLHDDINKSLKACYDVIRARVAAGGRPWVAP